MCFGGRRRKQNTIHFPASSRHRFPVPGRASTPGQAASQRAPLSRAHSPPPARPLGGRVAPGLTADHPAAEGFVAAEQRGAQQQPDHAAHCGAAAAAGVLRSKGGLCPPRSRGSNPYPSLPSCRPYSLRPSPAARPPARIAFGGTRRLARCCRARVCWARAHHPTDALSERGNRS